MTRPHACECFILFGLVILKHLKIVWHFTLELLLKTQVEFVKSFVTLEHKTSLNSHMYICSNRYKYIVWVKIIDFSFMPKIIRILSKDHVP